MNRTKIIMAVALTLIAAAIVGSGVARWQRAHVQTTSEPTSQTVDQTPPLPQFGSLLPEGTNVEVSGKAICGYCFWREGEADHNTVIQTATEPGIVFALQNKQLAELEKITGRCADGSYNVRVRGAVTQYSDRNYVLIDSFEVIPPSGQEAH